MSKSFYQFFLFWAGSFVCLYLAFASTVNIPYASHDSIRYFHKFYNKESNAQTLPMKDFLNSEGRFLTAALEEFLYKKVRHLSDMSGLRLFAIIVFALNASLLAMLATSVGMGAIPAFCLSTAIFTLPGVQQFIFVPYLPHTLAVFLSLLASFLLTKKLMWKLHIVLALLLLDAAFFIYPPSAFFFLVPTSLMVIYHHDWRDVRKKWFRDICLWIAVVVMNYFILKLFFNDKIQSTGHEITFTFKRIVLDATTFLTQGLPQTFNLWNVYYSKTLGISMMIFVAVFITIDFFVTKKIGWGRLVALSAIFLIFNLIWFLYGGYMPQEFIASQALALILVYWCGEWLCNIWKTKKESLIRIWSVFLMSLGLIITNQMVTSNVLNNHSELMFMRSRLAQLVNSSTKEIHVIRMKDASIGYNGLPRVYDNINSSADYYEIPDLIRVSLKDLSDPFELHCIVTYSNYGEPYNLLPNAVVIDMNDLVYISSSGRK